MRPLFKNRLSNSTILALYGIISTLMKIIGLVGGIGSGKSTVAKLIGQREGVLVVDADRLGHDVLRLDEVKLLIRAQWGNTPFDGDGEVDRRKMATIVFSGSEDGNANLEKLTTISHPHITELLKSQIEVAKMSGVRLVLLDAPLLLEGGWDRFCDILVFIDTPIQVRISRVLERGWTSEEFQARTANQLPLDVKRDTAHYAIENDCSLVELEQRIDGLFRQIFV